MNGTFDSIIRLLGCYTPIAFTKHHSTGEQPSIDDDDDTNDEVDDDVGSLPEGVFFVGMQFNLPRKSDGDATHFLEEFLFGISSANANPPPCPNEWSCRDLCVCRPRWQMLVRVPNRRMLVG